MDTSEILYSDHHGIYIPQMFGKDCASSFDGINFEVVVGNIVLELVVVIGFRK